MRAYELGGRDAGVGTRKGPRYSERPEDYQRNMDRLAKKFETARQFVPKPEVAGEGNAKVGIIAYGTTHWAIVESRDQLRQEKKLETDYLRLRAFPFTKAVAEFIDGHERVYVVEQNRDAQMFDLLRLDLTPAHISKMRSVRHYNGVPIDARTVTDEIISQEGR